MSREKRRIFHSKRKDLSLKEIMKNKLKDYKKEEKTELQNQVEELTSQKPTRGLISLMNNTSSDIKIREAVSGIDRMINQKISTKIVDICPFRPDNPPPAWSDMGIISGKPMIYVLKFDDWSIDEYRALTLHEYGHIKLTALAGDLIDHPSKKSIFNILEDIRLEEVWKALYPGYRRHFLRIGEHGIQWNNFDDDRITILGMGLLQFRAFQHIDNHSYSTQIITSDTGHNDIDDLLKELMDIISAIRGVHSLNVKDLIQGMKLVFKRYIKFIKRLNTWLNDELKKNSSPPPLQTSHRPEQQQSPENSDDTQADDETSNENSENHQDDTLPDDDQSDQNEKDDQSPSEDIEDENDIEDNDQSDNETNERDSEQSESNDEEDEDTRRESEDDNDFLDDIEELLDEQEGEGQSDQENKNEPENTNDLTETDLESLADDIEQEEKNEQSEKTSETTSTDDDWTSPDEPQPDNDTADWEGNQDEMQEGEGNEQQVDISIDGDESEDGDDDTTSSESGNSEASPGEGNYGETKFECNNETVETFDDMEDYISDGLDIAIQRIREARVEIDVYNVFDNIKKTTKFAYKPGKDDWVSTITSPLRFPRSLAKLLKDAKKRVMVDDGGFRNPSAPLSTKGKKYLDRKRDNIHLTLNLCLDTSGSTVGRILEKEYEIAKAIFQLFRTKAKFIISAFGSDYCIIDEDAKKFPKLDVFNTIQLGGTELLGAMKNAIEDVDPNRVHVFVAITDGATSVQYAWGKDSGDFSLNDDDIVRSFFRQCQKRKTYALAIGVVNLRHYLDLFGKYAIDASWVDINNKAHLQKLMDMFGNLIEVLHKEV